ncbi:hypothetical protein SGFS_005780 [Streptomyces graminofaciens]|uniref:Uncharacterized protein n=1 Tax=Streptomyces graminofaciens TaxID=68212 RepID=A0ABN5V7T5_9ACTN|nr:DUF6210 family protein [Streptomyces graminofaciens]BBC29284.1 hypothetical protein SGFS_005780 [Streptomyces graminofaciens]
MADTNASVGSKRYVFLDPDGSGADQGWVYVIVAAPTGVVYQVQGGGFCCIPYEQEGYLLPLFGRGLLSEVDEAWVPVVTPDGPGVLVWENSD